jgi:hypothetical protein
VWQGERKYWMKTSGDKWGADNIVKEIEERKINERIW